MKTHLKCRHFCVVRIREVQLYILVHCWFKSGKIPSLPRVWRPFNPKAPLKGIDLTRASAAGSWWGPKHAAESNTCSVLSLACKRTPHCLFWRLKARSSLGQSGFSRITAHLSISLALGAICRMFKLKSRRKSCYSVAPTPFYLFPTLEQSVWFGFNQRQ